MSKQIMGTSQNEEDRLDEAGIPPIQLHHIGLKTARFEEMRALEKGTPGGRYHGVGDEGIAWTQIAELIGRRLSVPVVSKSGKAASKHFGFLSLFAGIDNPVSSQ